MPSYPLALQLYSVREAAAQDFPGVLKKVAEMGYQGVEFAGFHGHTATELKAIVADLGMVTCSSHGAFPTSENISQIAEDAQILGYKYHVSGFGAQNMDSLEKARECAAKSQAAAKLCASIGLSFALHNHWWEFSTRYAGETAHELLMREAPNAVCELDTYWVTVGGSDPTACIQAYGDRAPLLHIKDGIIKQGGPMTAIGDGKLDWNTIIGAATPGITQWLIVELDACETDMMEAVAKSARYLIDNGFANNN